MASTAFADTKPWPTPQQAQAGIGHNKPPIDAQALGDFNDAVDRLKCGDVGVRERIKDLLGSASRVPAKVENDDTAGRCAELIRQMSSVEKLVDDTRSTVKAPYLAAGRNIDAAAQMLVAELGKAKSKVRGLSEAYLREKAAKEAAERRRLEEEQRRAREEAEAKARAEAEAAAAENRAPDPEIMEAPITVAAKPVEAEPTRVRSDFGAVASARRTKVAVIVDWKKAFNKVKDVPAVQEAVQKAVNALVRANPNAVIPGVEVKDDIGLSVR